MAGTILAERKLGMDKLNRFTIMAASLPVFLVAALFLLLPARLLGWAGRMLLGFGWGFSADSWRYWSGRVVQKG
jgi:hypothetical protein